MTPKLTKELREALQREPTKPLRVQDDETNRVYVIFDEQALPTLWDDYIRKEVHHGLAAIARGEVEEWDIEATIAEAKRRHAATDR